MRLTQATKLVLYNGQLSTIIHHCAMESQSTDVTADMNVT